MFNINNKLHRKNGEVSSSSASMTGWVIVVFAFYAQDDLLIYNVISSDSMLHACAAGMTHKP